MYQPRNEALAAAILAAAVLVVYANALTGPFQFDDYNVIVNNPAVHSFGAWLDSMPGIRPLLKLTYTLNWGADPRPIGFHAINVAVHGVNTILVYRLLRTVRGARGNDWVALIGALLFALHPAQTEAVTYVSGRSVSLMALFYLGSALTWLHADRAQVETRWRLLSAGLFGAALLVRESAVTLPFALLLLDAIGVRRPLTFKQMVRRQSWLGLILMAGVLVIACSPTYRRFLDVSLSTRGVMDNLLTQANAVGYLAGQLVRPWATNTDPDLPVFRSLTPAVGLEILVILALVGLSLWTLRRRSLLAFGILWFFLHLLPTNSLVPRLDVANDRQLYLASIGIFLALGAGVQFALERMRHRVLLGAVTTALLIVLGVATVQRNQAYASEVAFWQDAAAKSPLKPRVANNLGYVYQRAGRADEARAAYLRALELDPDYWRARINLEALEATRDR